MRGEGLMGRVGKVKSSRERFSLFVDSTEVGFLSLDLKVLLNWSCFQTFFRLL